MPKSQTYILCPVCQGHGTTVNPNIDANGLTAEDFDDPDFAESYRNGEYDIPCRGCDGKRVVTSQRIQELQQNAEDRALAARENGDYDSYSVAHDWRFG